MPDVPTVPDGPPVAPVGHVRPRRGAVLQPLAVGDADGVGAVPELLAELDAYLESQGIGDWATARELTYLPKWQQWAIPPREYWPNMANTLRVVEPIRQAVGPLTIRAYRPPGYNEAAGGAPDSMHLYFAAVDLRPSPNTAEKRRELALEGGRLFNAVGKAERMGLGVYGPKTPSNIHVDTDRARATTWRDAQLWAGKAAMQ